jgi:hypothetical protein
VDDQVPEKTSVADPVWYESGINQVSGSRRAKKTHISRKKLNFFKFWSSNPIRIRIGIQPKKRWIRIRYTMNKDPKNWKKQRFIKDRTRLLVPQKQKLQWEQKKLDNWLLYWYGCLAPYPYVYHKSLKGTKSLCFQKLFGRMENITCQFGLCCICCTVPVRIPTHTVLMFSIVLYKRIWHNKQKETNKLRSIN